MRAMPAPSAGPHGVGGHNLSEATPHVIRRRHRARGALLRQEWAPVVAGGAPG